MSSDSPPPAPSNDDARSVQQIVADFKELIRLAGAGDPNACQRLYNEFGHHVVRIIRRKLRHPLRKIVDSVDVAQDVWKSMFVNVLARRTFDDPAQFLQFLTGMIQNKADQQYRYNVRTQKRSLRREEPIGRHEDFLRDQSSAAGDPAARAEADDETAKTMAALSNRDRSLVEGLRDGERMEEAADRLHVAVKTVRRIGGLSPAF